MMGSSTRDKETVYLLHVAGRVGGVGVHVVRHWADLPLLHDLETARERRSVSRTSILEVCASNGRGKIHKERRGNIRKGASRARQPRFQAISRVYERGTGLSAVLVLLGTGTAAAAAAATAGTRLLKKCLREAHARVVGQAPAMPSPQAVQDRRDAAQPGREWKPSSANKGNRATTTKGGSRAMARCRRLIDGARRRRMGATREREKATYGRCFVVGLKLHKLHPR